MLCFPAQHSNLNPKTDLLSPSFISLLIGSFRFLRRLVTRPQALVVLSGLAAGLNAFAHTQDPYFTIVTHQLVIESAGSKASETEKLLRGAKLLKIQSNAQSWPLVGHSRTVAELNAVELDSPDQQVVPGVATLVFQARNDLGLAVTSTRLKFTWANSPAGKLLLQITPSEVHTSAGFDLSLEARVDLEKGAGAGIPIDIRWRAPSVLSSAQGVERIILTPESGIRRISSIQID